LYSTSPQWQELLSHQTLISDYVSVIGLELVIDEREGYAYIRQELEADDPLTLIPRHPLTFEQSLACVLLRRWADEPRLDTEGPLRFSTAEFQEQVALVFRDNPDGARQYRKLDTQLGQLAKLGLLRQADDDRDGNAVYELLPIIKARVTPQNLDDFYAQLQTYGRAQKAAMPTNTISLKDDE